MVPVLGVVTGADTLEIQDSSPWLPGTGWRRLLPGVLVRKGRMLQSERETETSRCFLLFQVL